MLDIRTPLSKDTRVSRKIDVANFVANPGNWVGIDNTGAAYNVTTTTPAVCKLCIGYASTNMYESNDVKVGRITTLETTGCRFGVDADGFTTVAGTPAAGNYLSVYSTASGDPTLIAHRGKLQVASTGETIVAVTEGYDSTTGILTFITTSPSIMPA
jgi:hypothetical protein